MQEAVKEAFENQEDLAEDVDVIRNELKPKINEFLFMNLPNKATLQETEALALALFRQMIDLWEAKANQQKGERV